MDSSRLKGCGSQQEARAPSGPLWVVKADHEGQLVPPLEASVGPMQWGVGGERPQLVDGAAGPMRSHTTGERQRHIDIMQRK